MGYSFWGALDMNSTPELGNLRTTGDYLLAK